MPDPGTPEEEKLQGVASPAVFDAPDLTGNRERIYETTVHRAAEIADAHARAEGYLGKVRVGTDLMARLFTGNNKVAAEKINTDTAERMRKRSELLARLRKIVIERVTQWFEQKATAEGAKKTSLTTMLGDLTEILMQTLPLLQSVQDMGSDLENGITVENEAEQVLEGIESRIKTSLKGNPAIENGEEADIAYAVRQLLEDGRKYYALQKTDVGPVENPQELQQQKDRLEGMLGSIIAFEGTQITEANVETTLKNTGKLKEGNITKIVVGTETICLTGEGSEKDWAVIKAQIKKGERITLFHTFEEKKMQSFAETIRTPGAKWKVTLRTGERVTVTFSQKKKGGELPILKGSMTEIASKLGLSKLGYKTFLRDISKYACEIAPLGTANETETSDTDAEEE